ncbi:MAG: SAM-dependent methyltransferase [Thermoplasmata archaeon]|nr:SAM-dependent methyltransferase [Thermoplasmata archaeon]
MRAGSLTVVGSGIQAVRQFTLEACAAIEGADVVLYSVADPITERWIQDRNPRSVSLRDSYRESRKRIDTYREMIERTLSRVRAGENVCVVYYGHPGIFVYPSHESIRRAREEGFEARMLPGISAEDCLFADLGVDPSRHGCQSFDASYFLVYHRAFDPRTALVLWQIGVIGDVGYHPNREFSEKGLSVLVNYLTPIYGPLHGVTVYEASQYVTCPPVVRRVALAELHTAGVTGLSTLYVPPIGEPELSSQMLEALGLTIDDLSPSEPETRPNAEPLVSGNAEPGFARANR